MFVCSAMNAGSTQSDQSELIRVTQVRMSFQSDQNKSFQSDQNISFQSDQNKSSPNRRWDQNSYSVVRVWSRMSAFNDLISLFLSTKSVCSKNSKH